jgi:hypothetical protein
MVEEDIGRARIVYEDPEDGTVEETVENEHVAYFQDHWMVKTGEDEGRDVVRRIPVQRVHYVERSVSEFAEEVQGLRSQVESFADSVRSKFLGGRGGGDDGGDDAEVHRIEVESGDDESEPQ